MVKIIKKISLYFFSTILIIGFVFIFPVHFSFADELVAVAHLEIPKININAVIENVGITSEKAMDIPKEHSDVGWFNLGPRPGENGSSVIAGHFGLWKDGTQAVFNNLYKLKKGDKVYIEDEKGVIITFVVRESRRYDPKADTSNIFSSKDEKAHLNLITCGGIFNKISKSYSNRLVVFTDKE